MTRQTVLSGETQAGDVRVQSGDRQAATRGYNQPQRKPRDGSWRATRLGCGLSIREVEEITGINRGELSRIERGFGPKPEHARALLHVYGIDS